MRKPLVSKDALVLAGLLVLSALAIVSSRGSAEEMSRKVKETTDSYALPPPEQVAALSLGYRAALADYLWADVLVEQGLHSFDRRRFEHLTLYIDTINFLDPKFRDPYLLVDSLTAFQAGGPLPEDVRKAREILERGVAERPDDGEIWLTLGTFVGLLAPSSYLTDQEEIDRWKMDGARYFAKAAALGDDTHAVGWGAISGVRLLRRAGRRTEAIRLLTATLASTDDEDLRAHVKDLLEQMTKAENAFEAAEERKAYELFRRREARLDEIWRASAVLTRTGVFLMNPPYDAAYCAGGSHAGEARCARTFRAWAHAVDAESAEQ